MISPLLKFFISAICLVALFWWADPSNIIGYLRSADLLWVSAAFAALTISTMAMAHRWQITARDFGVTLSYSFALREYYLAQLFNTVLPGGVMGDVTRVMRASQQADLTSAAQSVIAERLLGQVAIFAALAMGFAVALFAPSAILWGQWSWVILAALLVAGVTFYWITGRANASGRFLQHTVALYKKQAIALLGVVTTVALIFAFYACARSVGITIPPSGWLTLIPLVLCTMLVPVSVGGWGWREGAAAALFPLISASPSAGIATGITYGIVVMLAALPAIFILLVHSTTTLLPFDKGHDTP